MQSSDHNQIKHYICSILSMSIHFLDTKIKINRHSWQKMAMTEIWTYVGKITLHDNVLTNDFHPPLDLMAKLRHSLHKHCTTASPAVLGTAVRDWPSDAPCTSEPCPLVTKKWWSKHINMKHAQFFHCSSRIWHRITQLVIRRMATLWHWDNKTFQTDINKLGQET